MSFLGLVQLIQTFCQPAYVIPYVMIVLVIDHAVGISWLAVPDEHTYVNQGSPFSLRWYYKMDKNETFLSSDIEQHGLAKYKTIASRHKDDDKYYKYQTKDTSFLIFGRNNITFVVRHSKVGHNFTYCCEVMWRSRAHNNNKERRCSPVFVYDVPQITYHTPHLSCKQGDSIKLQCNATGIPKPHVDWIHDDTQELIDRSADIVLNITDKRSEGRYCCDANNSFGRKKACTTVNVIEYEPMNTTLSVKQTNSGDISAIHIKCKAVASPPSNKFIIAFNDTQYNSSDGVQTIEVPSPTTDKKCEIAVKCIPCNIYGPGVVKEVVLPLYAAPRFITPIRTQYNMTVNGTTLKCYATGYPSPNITWTAGETGNIVGTGNYYQIPYLKCAARTIRLYCHAKNIMGNIKSQEIRVEVMPSSTCSTVDKDLEETTQTFSREFILIAGTVVAILVIGLVFALVAIWRRKKNKRQEDADTTIPFNENPYQDPIDALTGRDGSQPIAGSNVISADDDTYATVEEYVPKSKTPNIFSLKDTRRGRRMKDTPMVTV